MEKPALRKSSTSWLNRRQPLFESWQLVDGARSRVSRLELREAYRLWAKHKDIRQGRVKL